MIHLKSCGCIHEAYICWNENSINFILASKKHCSMFDLVESSSFKASLMMTISSMYVHGKQSNYSHILCDVKGCMVVQI